MCMYVFVCFASARVLVLLTSRRQSSSESKIAAKLGALSAAVIPTLIRCGRRVAMAFKETGFRGHIGPLSYNSLLREYTPGITGPISDEQ